MALIDKKVTTIIFRDGTTPTPNTLEIKIGESNFTFNETVERIYRSDKGVLDSVIDGNQVPVEVSFAFIWEYYEGTTGTSGVPTPIDVLKGLNAASTWVSSDSDACKPRAVDIIVLYEPVPSTCGDKEEIVLADFRYESLAFDLDNSSISVTGKCNITAPTVTRSAQS